VAAAPAGTDVIPEGKFDDDDPQDDGDDDHDEDDEDGDEDTDGQYDEPEECQFEGCNKTAAFEWTFIKRDSSEERLVTCGDEAHHHDLLHHVRQHCKTSPKSIKALIAMFTPINQ
jgi:hypothetical protein